MCTIIGLLVILISVVDLFFSTHIIPGPVYYTLGALVTGFALVSTRK